MLFELRMILIRQHLLLRKTRSQIMEQGKIKDRQGKTLQIIIQLTPSKSRNTQRSKITLNADTDKAINGYFKRKF